MTLRLVIIGRVQGVSFRATLRERALRNQVDGWVRNRNDGSVEALVQGEEERVSDVVEWARFGPRGAWVSSLIDERLESYPRQTGFNIVG